METALHLYHAWWPLTASAYATTCGIPGVARVVHTPGTFDRFLLGAPGLGTKPCPNFLECAGVASSRWCSLGTPSCDEWPTIL